jgi:hypothetical protein
MKKIALVVSLLISCIFPNLTHAAQPLIATHTLTDSTTDGKDFTLKVTLHLVNAGDTAVSNLTLSLVPISMVVSRQVKVTVGDLAPHASTDATVQLVTPRPVDAKAFSRTQLYWAATGDADGARIEFPVTSGGGAK